MFIAGAEEYVLTKHFLKITTVTPKKLLFVEKNITFS